MFPSFKCSRYDHPSISGLFIPASNGCSGFHTCRSLSCGLGPLYREGRFFEAWKSCTDRHWCCIGFIRWDRLRHDRFPIPMRRYFLWGCPNLHGSAAATRRRVQDGSSCFIVLLCPSMCIDEPYCSTLHGSSTHPDVWGLCCWALDFFGQCFCCIFAQCFSCLPGKQNIPYQFDKPQLTRTSRLVKRPV